MDRYELLRPEKSFWIMFRKINRIIEFFENSIRDNKQEMILRLVENTFSNIKQNTWARMSDLLLFYFL